MDEPKCLFCETTFTKKFKREKYCSIRCCRKYNNKKQLERKKLDNAFREQFNERERKRKNKKYASCPIYKAKRLNKAWAKGIESERIKKLQKYRYKNQYGYILIWKPDHPNAHRSGRVMEHVYVMSEHLKRPLLKEETIHHKNGIRDDNRLENLELWCKSHPYGQRVCDMISYCKEFLEKYGHTVILKPTD